jgi:hypothetical protein
MPAPLYTLPWTLAHPHAQRTLRLQEALCQIRFAIGGQAGARVGSELIISGSRDTILRLVRQHHLPDPPMMRIAGVDDWAWNGRTRESTQADQTQYVRSREVRSASASRASSFS